MNNPTTVTIEHFQLFCFIGTKIGTVDTEAVAITKLPGIVIIARDIHSVEKKSTTTDAKKTHLSIWSPSTQSVACGCQGTIMSIAVEKKV